MNHPLVTDTIAAIKRVVGERPAGLHEPSLTGDEASYAAECVRSGWVSSVGPYVDEFETQLAEYTGARFAVAVVNGTAALHVALRLAGVTGGDEVLVPSLSFVATANAVAYCGATPHFADVSEVGLGLDPHKLQQHLKEISEARSDRCYNRMSGRRIAAILPMHTYGHPCDMDALQEVAARFRLPIVEDAAEALGSFHHGRHAGTLGLLGIFSFNGNKVVTTGGGGAIVTNDRELADQAKHLTTTAKRPHPWEYYHDAVGYNYRMTNINAAIGCAQLKQLAGFLTRKRRLAERYAIALQEIQDVSFVTEPPGTRSNYWLNTIRLSQAAQHLRSQLLEASNAAGIMARPCWTPLHQLPMYSNCPRMDLTSTVDLASQLVNMPSSASLAVSG